MERILFYATSQANEYTYDKYRIDCIGDTDGTGRYIVRRRVKRKEDKACI